MSRLLDAAERLFAEKGYDRVTVAEIARAARSTVAVVKRRYGSKRGLLQAVIARRAPEINKARMAALNRHLNKVGTGTPDAGAIVAAFVSPYVAKRVAGDAGWQRYGVLITKVAADARQRALLAAAYDPVARAFMAALLRALPEAEEEAVYRAYQFVLAATYSAGAGEARVDSLSGGRYSGRNYTHAAEVLIPFLSAGLKALPRCE